MAFPAKSLIVPETLEERERLLLASYAMHSGDTAGRLHDEPAHPYRGPFARDRDRILHSSAFRRLSGKMQVFTGEMGVYHRTRLTHTFEVSSVARTMARSLQLNEDLTEALALMHDIGHPPYGHCGEDVLAEKMESVGGFSHNRFALVIVGELEQRYTDFAGLNLSRETLGGQDARAHKDDSLGGSVPLLEVQIVDAADSIAYNAHDVDDALQMGLLTIEQLAELSIIRRSLDVIREKRRQPAPSQLRQSLVHELIEMQVNDFLKVSANRLADRSGSSAAEVRRSGLRLKHSERLARERTELEGFLFESVYRHPNLIPIREAAGQRLRAMFAALVQQPNRLPMRFRERGQRVHIERVVGEYLAGMTDAFCDAQHDVVVGGGGTLADW